MELVHKFPVLGLPVNIHEDYCSCVQQRINDRQGTHIVTLNAEMAMQARNNPELGNVVSQADLVIPDGAGIVLFLRSQGEKISRCPGIELAENLVKLSLHQQWRLFLIGGAEGVTQSVANNWQQQLPGVAIVGTHNGYFNQAEEQVLCEHLQAAQPDLILVGLGVPRQEFWIQKYRHLCPKATWIGVGGSFDIWCGLKNRAPRWLREHHLEWVYRLYQEPWRWRRMLALPRFAWCVTRQSLHQAFTSKQSRSLGR